MAEISDSGGGGHKGGKKRAKKQSTRIDMTPMVDLAFLLLTFFVLTSTFSKPKSMELTFPAPPNPNDPKTEIKKGITFLLSKDDRIFYYEGQFRDKPEEGKPATELQELNFSQDGSKSLHKFLLDKNEWIRTEIKKLDDKLQNKQIADTTFKRMAKTIKADKDRAFTYLIKTDDKATYKNVVDLIDELNFNLVGKYVITDIIKPELDLVNAKVN
ncbi:MAG: biopolymer transporter ExbD [Bacteroidetes bacterium]|nr:biopolymer transporter ExbD [Bacteroidota bacterium]